MSRTLVALAGLLALAAGGATEEPPASPPAPWRHNPRARTGTAIEQLADGQVEAARAAFDQALALDPDEPVLQFNSGTASLLSGQEPAVDLLTAAAQAAPPDLGADAYYNLGNAQLANRDASAAIEAFEQSLRLEPGKLDAKHNLELARRLLEQQQQQQQQQQDPGDSEDDSQRDQQQPNEEQEQEQQQEQQQQPGDDSQPQPDEQAPPEDSRQPLPDFEEQPEMTAEQAAAILEAVENLEREQRRKQALEQRKRAKGDLDW